MLFKEIKTMTDEKYKEEAWLREKYQEEGLTTGEVGDLCGVTSGTIVYWMEKNGIDRLPQNRPRGSVQERFWDKVDKAGRDECWIWTGATKGFGYGNFWDGERYVGAHRVAYQLEEGDPGDKNVLHHCDNPPCVNPNHLYAGTHEENAADRERRNPWDRSGENAGRAKLSQEQVRDIKNRLGEDTQQELADEHGVARSTISHIALGHNWGEE